MCTARPTSRSSDLGTPLVSIAAARGKDVDPPVYQAPFAVDLFGDGSTVVEPDLSVVCDRAKLSDRGCEGAPGFVVEVVSPGNPGMDYVTKLGLYKEAGVREYWICYPMRGRTHVYRLDADAVPSICPFSARVPSSVLAGFEVAFAPIVDGM